MSKELSIKDIPEKEFIESLRNIIKVYFPSQEGVAYDYLIEACCRLENKSLCQTSQKN